LLLKSNPFYAGNEFIGMEKMVAIAKWCEENNIPMVVE